MSQTSVAAASSASPEAEIVSSNQPVASNSGPPGEFRRLLDEGPSEAKSVGEGVPAAPAVTHAESVTPVDVAVRSELSVPVVVTVSALQELAVAGSELPPELAEHLPTTLAAISPDPTGVVPMADPHAGPATHAAGATAVLSEALGAIESSGSGATKLSGGAALDSAAADSTAGLPTLPSAARRSVALAANPDRGASGPTVPAVPAGPVFPGISELAVGPVVPDSGPETAPSRPVASLEPIGSGPNPSASGANPQAAALAGGAPSVVRPEPAVVLPVTAPVGSEQWSQDVSNRITWIARQDMGIARLELSPPELGPINVKVAVQGDHAQIAISAQHALTRDALDGTIERLRDALIDEGFANVDVNVGGREPGEQGAEDDRQFGTDVNESITDLEPTARSLPTRGLLDHYA